LRPTIIKAFGNPLAPAQFGNAVFAAKSIEYDPNLIFSRIVLPRRPPNVSDDLFGGRLCRPGFLSHLRSSIGYDEPEILLSSPHSFCPIRADVEQPESIAASWTIAVFRERAITGNTAKGSSNAS